MKLLSNDITATFRSIYKKWMKPLSNNIMGVFGSVYIRELDEAVK